MSVTSPENMLVENWLEELRMECYKKQLEKYYLMKVCVCVCQWVLTSTSCVGVRMSAFPLSASA